MSRAWSRVRLTNGKQRCVRFVHGLYCVAWVVMFLWYIHINGVSTTTAGHGPGYTALPAPATKGAAGVTPFRALHLSSSYVVVDDAQPQIGMHSMQNAYGEHRYDSYATRAMTGTQPLHPNIAVLAIAKAQGVGDGSRQTRGALEASSWIAFPGSLLATAPAGPTGSVAFISSTAASASPGSQASQEWLHSPPSPSSPPRKLCTSHAANDITSPLLLSSPSSTDSLLSVTLGDDDEDGVDILQSHAAYAASTPDAGQARVPFGAAAARQILGSWYAKARAGVPVHTGDSSSHVGASLPANVEESATGMQGNKVLHGAPLPAGAHVHAPARREQESPASVSELAEARAARAGGIQGSPSCGQTTRSFVWPWQRRGASSPLLQHQPAHTGRYAAAAVSAPAQEAAGASSPRFSPSRMLWRSRSVSDRCVATGAPPPPGIRARVVFLGASGCGKTALAHRVTDPGKPMSRAYSMSIGAECFHHARPAPSGVSVNMVIWDFTGAPQYRALTRSYYLHTHVICMVYDCTDAVNTLNELLVTWLPKEIQVFMRSAEPFTCMLVGCKLDAAMARGRSRWSAPPEASRVQEAAQAVCGAPCPHVLVSVPDQDSVSAFADALREACVETVRKTAAGASRDTGAGVVQTLQTIGRSRSAGAPMMSRGRQMANPFGEGGLREANQTQSRAGHVANAEPAFRAPRMRSASTMHAAGVGVLESSRAAQSAAPWKQRLRHSCSRMSLRRAWAALTGCATKR
jgi:hypothetical protein